MNDKQIKFKYVFDKDYNPVYCNGAYGGINPQGDIVANFYFERSPIPNHVIHDINDDGTLSGVVSSDPSEVEQYMIRYVNGGIILNIDSAKSIHEWLGGLISELEAKNGNSTESE